MHWKTLLKTFTVIAIIAQLLVACVPSASPTAAPASRPPRQRRMPSPQPSRRRAVSCLKSWSPAGAVLSMITWSRWLRPILRRPAIKYRWKKSRVNPTRIS